MHHKCKRPWTLPPRARAVSCRHRRFQRCHSGPRAPASSRTLARGAATGAPRSTPPRPGSDASPRSAPLHAAASAETTPLRLSRNSLKTLPAPRSALRRHVLAAPPFATTSSSAPSLPRPCALSSPGAPTRALRSAALSLRGRLPARDSLTAPRAAQSARSRGSLLCPRTSPPRAALSSAWLGPTL